MSYPLKLGIFVLAIDIMALAVGHLMRGLGLYRLSRSSLRWDGEQCW
jgi:hypothetical protein